MVLSVLCLKHKRLFRPPCLSVHIAKCGTLFPYPIRYTEHFIISHFIYAFGNNQHIWLVTGIKHDLNER